jgi:hypothetical protein
MKTSLPCASLFSEISALIEQARSTAISQANFALTLLFWKIGRRVNEEILQNQRADYGKRIVVTLARQLAEKYGRNFEEKNLRRMLQFAEQFPEEQIVGPLARQLSWSHFLMLLPLKTHEAKLFYAQKVIEGCLGKRDLRQLISRKAFERTAIADAQLAPNSPVPQGTFKDPYLFDFLGLKNDYLENDLETAILRELESFILEFGKGFAFVGSSGPPFFASSTAPKSQKSPASPLCLAPLPGRRETGLAGHVSGPYCQSIPSAASVAIGASETNCA